MLIVERVVSIVVSDSLTRHRLRWLMGGSVTRVAGQIHFFRRLVHFCRLSTPLKWPTQQSPSQLWLYVNGASLGPRTPLRRLPWNNSLTFLLQQRLEARKHEAPKAVSYVGALYCLLPVQEVRRPDLFVQPEELKSELEGATRCRIWAASLARVAA